MTRLTPISLNREEHHLYYSANTVVKMNRMLRTFERLAKDETISKVAALIGSGDDEAIAVAIFWGLEHERNPSITVDKLIGWLDDVKSKRPQHYFTEVQLPIFEALKAAGQITFDVRAPSPEAAEEGADARPTGAATS